MNATLVIQYNVSPDVLEKQIAETTTEAVRTAYIELNECIIIKKSDIPEKSGRQLFCALCGVSEAKFYKLIKDKTVKAEILKGDKQVNYLIHRDELWKYYKSKR